MVEFCVETESETPVPIQDLNLFVSKHKPVYISSEQVRSSLILAELRSIGRVRLSSTVRFTRRNKVASPPPVEFQEPGPKGVHKPPAPPQRPARVAPPKGAPDKKGAAQALPEAPAEPVKKQGGRKPPTPSQDEDSR